MIERARDDGKFHEEEYQCGEATYTRKDLALSGEKIRREDEQENKRIPGIRRLLGKDGKYDPEKSYPTLSGEEVELIIKRCENLPENKGGGRNFLIHNTGKGTIAVSQTDDTKVDGKPAKAGLRILEFERTQDGNLREVPKGRVSYRKNSPRLIRANHSEDQINSIDNERAENSSEKIVNPELATKRQERESCRQDLTDSEINEAQPRRKNREKDENQNTRNLTNAIKDERKKRTNDKEREKEVEDKESDGEMDEQLRSEIQAHFPPLHQTTHPPLTERPTEGLLAAREIIPIAQYNK
jgi:hypothetical protein